MSTASPTFRPASTLGAYARWWLDELRGLLPATVAGWFAGDGALTDVGIDDQSVRLLRIERGQVSTVQSVARAELGTSPVLRGIVANEQERVRLVLSTGQVLVRTLSLPSAIEENLAEAIGFEIDRVTPFKADQVHHAACVVGRDAQQDTIEVLLVVAQRARLDAWLAGLRQGGLAVVEAGAEPALTRGLFIDLLPAAMKPDRRWSQMTRINLALAAVAGALLLLALLLPIWQKRERVIALIPMVDKAESEFAANRKVYDDYARLAGEYNHIATRKHAAQPVLAVIEEVTRISPDTTFTQTMELKSTGKVRELVMMGEAASASKVIESLEQSPLFQNATQRAQTTRGSQANTERYHVSTEVKPRPVPAAVLAALEPVAPAVLPAEAVNVVPPAATTPPESRPPTADAKAGNAGTPATGSAPPVAAGPPISNPNPANGVQPVPAQVTPIAPAKPGAAAVPPKGTAAQGGPAPATPPAPPPNAKGQP
ncbi:MAG: hypothetical protein JNK75_00715 [Betaproteobacteria bacterium]|nr:hypothetical protein [Betaproteobacteria bacterium]